MLNYLMLSRIAAMCLNISTAPASASFEGATTILKGSEPDEEQHPILNLAGYAVLINIAANSSLRVRSMKISLLLLSRAPHFTLDGLPYQLRSLLYIVDSGEDIADIPFLFLDVSRYIISAEIFFCLKYSFTSVSACLKSSLWAFMSTAALRTDETGIIPVSSPLACFFRHLFLKKFFKAVSIVVPEMIADYFELAAISSRISCFAAFQRGMSIFVPMTSTTFAAIMDPTSPHTLSGIPSECA